MNKVKRTAYGLLFNGWLYLKRHDEQGEYWIKQKRMPLLDESTTSKIVHMYVGRTLPFKVDERLMVGL